LSICAAAQQYANPATTRLRWLLSHVADGCSIHAHRLNRHPYLSTHLFLCCHSPTQACSSAAGRKQCQTQLQDELNIDVHDLCTGLANGAALSPCCATQATLLSALSVFLDTTERLQLVKGTALVYCNRSFCSRKECCLHSHSC
jgi:hypothetical protein